MEPENTTNEEGGACLKWLTNSIRKGGVFVDMIPLLGADDVAAATCAGVAGLIDTGEQLVRGNLQGTAEELAAGTLETGVALTPLVEYAQGLSWLGLDVADLQGHARNLGKSAVRSVFNTSASTESDTARPDVDAPVISGNSPPVGPK